MKRTNIYLTDSQEKDIANILKNKGGGTKAEFVRSAIDHSIKKYNKDLPKTLEQVCKLVNKYTNKNLNFESLSDEDKGYCNSLLNYLQNQRFIYQINTFENQENRELLESAFVIYLYDKLNLAANELDNYIILSVETVISSKILRTIDLLEREQEKNLNENGKLSLSLIEAMNTARNEYNSTIKRQQSLFKIIEYTQEKKNNK